MYSIYATSKTHRIHTLIHTTVNCHQLWYIIGIGIAFILIYLLMMLLLMVLMLSHSATLSIDRIKCVCVCVCVWIELMNLEQTQKTAFNFIVYLCLNEPAWVIRVNQSAICNDMQMNINNIINNQMLCTSCVNYSLALFFCFCFCFSSAIVLSVVHWFVFHTYDGLYVGTMDSVIYEKPKGAFVHIHQYEYL